MLVSSLYPSIAPKPTTTQTGDGGYIAAMTKPPAAIAPPSYAYKAILPPAFNYTPGGTWQQQLQAAQNPQFTGLLNGFAPQQQAPIYNGFNAPTPNGKALAAQYLK